MHPERRLSAAERDQLESLVARRAGCEPMAYILGEREFYSRSFSVGPGVLVPRPETEHVVETALEYCAGTPAPRILDIGTGSGCIAITLAAALPHARVEATDISETALRFARENARRHGVEVCFRSGDLEAGCVGPYDVIVSNPPYVEAGAALPADVADHEPAIALFAGDDGLDLYRRLALRLPALRPRAVVLEIGAGQFEGVACLFPWLCCRLTRDLAGQERVLHGKLQEGLQGRLQ
jgi:release factor glutamine methyltransferase